MKHLKLVTIIIVIFLHSCAGDHKSKGAADSMKISKLPKTVGAKNNDKEEIQNLIRNVLVWRDSKASMELMPLLTDSKDSLFIGFDLKVLNENLEKLRATNFFSTEFIGNYDHIITTLDKKMKNREFDKWSTGELPPFSFANDVDPWCDCQDVPYDNPNPSGMVEVYVVNLNRERGELYWKWGKLGADVSQDWRDFSYKFKVKKEDGRWKISYLQGFDFNQGVKI